MGRSHFKVRRHQLPAVVFYRVDELNRPSASVVPNAHHVTRESLLTYLSINDGLLACLPACCV